MAGYNPAKGMRYDPFYTPPHQRYVHSATAIRPQELGLVGRLFRFVFLTAIFAFLALIGLVFVEAAGGPTPLNFSLVEVLDRASGWEPSERGSDLGSRDPDSAERFRQEADGLRAEFERMAQDYEDDGGIGRVGPPEEFGWDEPLGSQSD